MSKIRNAEERGVASGKILIGGVLGLILTVILTFGAAIALNREVLSLDACSWLGPVIIALSSFFAALVAAGNNGKKLMCGLLAAVLYGSGLMIAGLLLFSTTMQPGRLALSVGALLLGGFVGVFCAGMRA